tara:strand:- start:748 stop:993 length:246 start_codon:yes stop_codon:yes gene_type:complete
MDSISPEDKLQIDEANSKTAQFIFELLKDKNPMVVAGVLTAMALGLYKTILDEEEYEIMIDSISESRHVINNFGADIRTLH